MKFLSNILVKAGLIVDGSTTLNTIANATTDTDKFLVSDAGVVKYRTGSEVLSDIGAQGSLTLTTTGSSGAATLVGNTLNIPQYAGTVTSVAMTVPTGLQVGGSPIISSGTLALTFQSGYSIPTNVKQGNWDDAYTWVSNFPTQTGNNGKYLTTDGNTLSWGTINISGYVPTSRSLTINGTAYDLSLDRSWSVGTITSITGGTGLTGGTITSSGTLAFDTTWGDARYQQLLTNPVTGSGTAGQVAYFTGSNSVGGSSAFTFSPTAQLLLNNSVTASSAIARGANLTPSLSAAANNDVLVGLDVNPTFTNGAFTGVSNIALRVAGPASITGTGTQVPLTLSAASTANNTMVLRHSGTYNAIQLNNNAGTPVEAGVIGWGNSTAATQLQNAFYFLVNTGNVATASTRFTRYNGAAILVDGMFSSAGNFLLNTTTDAGFRLDVNGTARVQGATTISGSVNSTATNQYFNTWQGTQNVSGIAAFGTTVHTYFNPTISSSSTNLRPVALSVVPTFSGTIDTKVAVFASTSGSAAVTLGANAAFLASSSETNAVGLLSSVSGTNSSGVMISSTPTIGLNITSNPTIAIRINSVSTTGAFTPFETIQLLSGTPTASRYIVRNTTASNSTVISTFDFINSSTSSTGGALGNNAGIQLRLGISNPTFQERYTSIAAIAPNQTSLPDVVDLRFQVSNASGTTTNALYLSSQGHTLTTFDNTTGLTISGSSLTGSNAQSLVSLSQTWNTTGNPTAIKLDVTNTASGANSYLLDLQVGGIPQFTVFKGGEIKTSSPAGGVAQTWKLGSVQAVTPTSPNRTIEVEVNGTTYYLHAKTTND